jgi:hypothetical protein
MLFVIAVDVLQKMLQSASDLLRTPISNKIEQSVLALQYANYTALISAADTTSLATLRLVFGNFA